MTTDPRPTLGPCEVTGLPCSWQSEEWYGTDGEMESWDDFCRDCGAWRDWSKDECPSLVAAQVDSTEVPT